jgi:hypothetical protein
MPRSARLDQLLSVDSHLQPLLAKMREIRSLTRQCNEFLPPELARAVRASNLRDGRLVLLAANAAAAAKLRLLIPSLTGFLEQQGAKINSVSVRLQPRQVNISRAEPRRALPLSPAAQAALSSLYARLGESPARRALKAFLDREARARKRATPRQPRH